MLLLLLLLLLLIHAHSYTCTRLNTRSTPPLIHVNSNKHSNIFERGRGFGLDLTSNHKSCCYRSSFAVVYTRCSVCFCCRMPRIRVQSQSHTHKHTHAHLHTDSNCSDYATHTHIYHFLFYIFANTFILKAFGCDPSCSLFFPFVFGMCIFFFCVLFLLLLFWCWLIGVRTHTILSCSLACLLILALALSLLPVFRSSFTFSKVIFRIQSEINWIYFWPGIGLRNVHFEKFPIRLIAVIILFPWHFHRLILWLPKYLLFWLVQSKLNRCNHLHTSTCSSSSIRMRFLSVLLSFTFACGSQWNTIHRRMRLANCASAFLLMVLLLSLSLWCHCWYFYDGCLWRLRLMTKTKLLEYLKSRRTNHDVDVKHCYCTTIRISHSLNWAKKYVCVRCCASTLVVVRAFDCS